MFAYIQIKVIATGTKKKSHVHFSSSVVLCFLIQTTDISKIVCTFVILALNNMLVIFTIKKNTKKYCNTV